MGAGFLVFTVIWPLKDGNFAGLGKSDVLARLAS